MLSGVLKYRDLSSKDYSGDGGTYTFKVDSAEFPDALWMNVGVDSENFMEVLRANNLLFRIVNPDKCKEDFTDRMAGVCRVDVGKTVKTNAINTIFSARLGSAVQYALSMPNRRVLNSSGLTMSEREIGVQGTDEYARFVAEFNCSVPIHIEIHTKYLDLDISSSDGQRVFNALKEKDKWGKKVSITPISQFAVKRSKEFLGFEEEIEVEETVPVWGMYQTIEEVIKAHPEKNTQWILDRHYEIVTKDNLQSVLEEFYNYDGYIAFDTETTGLRVRFQSLNGDGDTMVGFSLSKNVGEGYYFPVAHKRFENLTDDITYFMQTYIKPILECKPIICHNTSFDWKVGYLYGLNVNVVFDTMVAFSCTHRYKYGKSYDTGLKSLVKTLLGYDMFELEDFVIGSWGTDSSNFSDLPYELVRRYATADADMTLSLYYWLMENNVLQEYNAVRVHDLEVQFQKVVGYSEFYGYRVDIGALPKLIEETTSAMRKHEQEMYRIAGHEFNPNSSQQLSKIMYEELGIEMIDGQTSTKADILEELGRMEDLDGNPRYPFVKELLAYRSHEGTYKNFIKKREQFMTADGFIFPSVYAFGTDTGRVSIKNPNYQSYDKLVKHYIKPRDKFYHFDCDFSQIEYRVLASMAQQENLCEAFADPDMDYHTYQASRMFGVPYESVTPDIRSQSKGINFGLPYGMEDRSLGKRIFGKASPENTAKATLLRKKYFKGQEKIQQFFEVVRAQGVAEGYTETWLGRRRYYNKKLFDERSIRRQAGNHVIQGSSADIYKMGVVALFEMVVRKGWLGKVLFDAFVHDEILIEIHQSISPYVFLKFWRDEYQVRLKGFCQLYAGCGFGHNWYEAKTQDLPPQFIQECIDRVQDDVDDTWDDDIEGFLVRIKTEFHDYKVRRVKEFLTDKANDGAVVKPLINSLLLELVCEKSTLSKGEIRSKSLDEKIAMFKDLYDFRVGTVHILPPDDSGRGDTDVNVDVKIAPMDKLERQIATCLSFGMSVDTAEGVVYIKFFDNQKFMDYLRTLCIPEGDEGYRLRFVVKKENGVQVMRTKFSIRFGDTFMLQTMCRRLGGKVTNN